MPIFYANRIRRAYVRRRTIGEMALATVLLLAITVLLAVAACETEEPPVTVTADLSAGQRQEIVRSWYAEIYPAYVAPRR